ncbi:unnamed protein product [Meganyctiphanes norvegica]|uniref:Large ribosomal subunit protein mL64 n=1 Tax=Meganyctiphanes norvegica TaxID=48144 RepID=A0AAV2RH07_MEGNR
MASKMCTIPVKHIQNITKRGITTRLGGLSQEAREEYFVEDEDIIEQKRNKSRLRPWHYKQYHKQAYPIDEGLVRSLKFERRLYGRHGSSSGIDISKLWPTVEELALKKEWENVAYPLTVQEMISNAKLEKIAKQEAIDKRQAGILAKVGKLEMWKKEVRNRFAAKEKAALESKEKKERLIEEVRQIFGFRIDPKDERFKQALEKKELEERKALKAAKKLEKQKRMISKMQTIVDEATTQGGEIKQSSDLQGQVITGDSNPK